MKKTSLATALLFSMVPMFSWAAGSADAEVSLSPAGDFKAKCEEVSGHATMKGDSISAENVVVTLKNLKTGIALRDKHAREKYLEVAKYPTMTLIKAEGKGGKGKGRIKYRGVEKDIEGTYKIEGDQLVAHFPIKLSDFNIKGIKYMGVGVDDDVKINVNLPLKKN